MFLRKGPNYFISLILVLVILCGSFSGKAWAMTIEEEKKMGKKIFLEMERGVEFVKDPTLQAFLDRMGQSLVSTMGTTPFEFKFYLIKVLDPNAYALPGGYIFVTTGLITLAENENEVAGVLSHEISHVTQRHVYQMIERSKRMSIAMLAAILAGVLAGGGGKVSEAATAGAVAMAEAQALKYTRENETDADQNSLKYMLKAGYDPGGLITFLTKLQKVSLASAVSMSAGEMLRTSVRRPLASTTFPCQWGL